MIRKLIYFLPTQLLLTNLKRNHIILILWIILFGVVNQNLFVKYGIPNLFLAPEYLNELSFWAYAIFGVSIGGFVMAFNITGYVINSSKFPFLAALKYPFTRYCINNSLLPFLFVLFYCYKMSMFLHENENISTFNIIIYNLAFLSGYVIFITISLSYFFSTNQHIFKLLGISENSETDKRAINSLVLRDKNWYSIFKNKQKWHVEYYLYNPFSIRPARDISHYDLNMLKSIFKQNNINATIFEIVLFATFIGLGFLNAKPLFMIPAAASIVLLFTTVLILFSAVHTWLKAWSPFAFIALFLVVNLLSKNQKFSYTNQAYGLNYGLKKTEYSNKILDSLRFSIEDIEADKLNQLSILNKWTTNFDRHHKPKLILINTSGGGSRSSLWTFYSLQFLDSITNGNMFKHTHLITGSSGGMIGAAYFRELYLRQSEGLINDLYNQSYRTDISNDLLNPIAFYLATNDFFIRTKKFTYNNQIYLKDRGYAFERQLLLNTHNLFDKTLKDYKIPEENAQIPMMIFSPVITNDARRLLISPQPISFLSNNIPRNNVYTQPTTENVEFSSLFKNQDANNVRFSSVIRMSATFPYIMPSVSLPTTPQVNVLDAGLRDNYGAVTTYKYIHTFKNWIEENTSGVIILTFRDKPKEHKIDNNPLQSIVESISLPIGSLYSNLFYIQDYNLDDMMQYLSEDFNSTIDIIDFELDNVNDRISLSWHLTSKEKENTVNSMYSKNNQKSTVRLIKLLEE
ncbi:MAG: patatin-like phospholipase family protein [Bacteroidetes bacterium]|nr:patatin-like phospholipase family protein [Bacteroidota bacterium]